MSQVIDDECNYNNQCTACIDGFPLEYRIAPCCGRSRNDDIKMRLTYHALYIPTGKTLERAGRFENMLDFYKKLAEWNGSQPGVWQYYA